MKRLRIAVFFVCTMLLAFSSALSEGFFMHSDKIVHAEVCPEGYISVSSPLLLGEGETRVITNEAKYYASDNMNVVSIDENGVVQALSAGKTTLSIYFADDIRKDLQVEVKNAPKSIKLNKSKGTLAIGETYQLKATLTKSTVTTIAWSSSDTDIAVVSEEGLIHALSEGECTVTARTHNGHLAECRVTVKKPAPAQINLATDSVTLSVGDTASIVYTLEGGYQETIHWTIDDPAVALVDADGVITAVNTGKTVVCMEASGGDIRFVDIIVEEGATSVEFPSTELTLYTGGRTVFEPIITGGSGTYEFVSMDDSIASIDPETGEICALRTGEVYILAITPNLTFGEFLLSIVEGPEKLELFSDKTVIAIGETLQTRTGLASFDPLYTWYETSNPEVAHVNEYGIVSGVSKGSAVISVHSGGHVGKLEITVLPMAKSLSAWSETTVMGVGDSCKSFYTLDGGTGTVEYASSDMYVAQVDADTGTIYALSQGVCEITLSLPNGASSSFPIEVSPAPESVSIEKGRYTLAANNRHLFRFSINDGAVTRYTVSSSNPEIVRYEDGSLITQSGTGNAVITVQTHNGLSASAEISVIEEPAEISVTAEKLLMNPDFDYYLFLSPGKKHALNPRVENVPDIAYVISASHPDIADADENGVVTARNTGTSLITVSLFSDAQARILVCVQ